jgi:hypothetical protein
MKSGSMSPYRHATYARARGCVVSDGVGWLLRREPRERALADLAQALQHGIAALDRRDQHHSPLLLLLLLLLTVLGLLLLLLLLAVLAVLRRLLAVLGLLLGLLRRLLHLPTGAVT